MKQPLPMQLFELWTLAPQVIANRLFRLSTATQLPAKSDIWEMNEMWIEKVIAAGTAMQAVTMDSAKFQAKAMSEVVGTATSPALLPQALTQIMFRYAPTAGMKMTESMIKPFHSKVKSNAKRLL